MCGVVRICWFVFALSIALFRHLHFFWLAIAWCMLVSFVVAAVRVRVEMALRSKDEFICSCNRLHYAWIVSYSVVCCRFTFHTHADTSKLVHLWICLWGGCFCNRLPFWMCCFCALFLNHVHLICSMCILAVQHIHRRYYIWLIYHLECDIILCAH